MRDLTLRETNDFTFTLWEIRELPEVETGQRNAEAVSVPASEEVESEER